MENKQIIFEIEKKDIIDEYGYCKGCPCFYAGCGLEMVNIRKIDCPLLKGNEILIKLKKEE